MSVNLLEILGIIAFLRLIATFVIWHLERFSNECRKTKTKVNYSSQSQETQITQWTNQNSKQIHVTGAKRGKTCDRFEFYFWLVEKVARDFLTNPREKRSKTKSIRKLLSTLNWKPLYNLRSPGCIVTNDESNVLWRISNDFSDLFKWHIHHWNMIPFQNLITLNKTKVRIK